MSETKNPFEQALNMTAGAADPFASADPFAAAPPIDLGSADTTETIESPAEAKEPAGAADTEPEKPVIDLGSQPDAPHLQVLETPSKADAVDESAEIENPIAAAMEKQDKAEQKSIFAKPPVFEHGAVKEPIENLDQTFEDLRAAKSDDFPELEDSIRVSWDVTYGKIRKSVPTPKKTKIGEFKKQIESSKEFIDALKKDKNKNPDCIIKPRITAQSKGKRMPLPTYKGIFTTMDEAQASGKIICIVPGSDGKVYEMRHEEAGVFTTPSGECRELSEIRAGFNPALPLIPHHELRKVIGFFRSVMTDGANFEAIANIYWDREREEYLVAIPRQRVTSVRAESELSDEYDQKRYLHYMDIHSHNVMAARFSAQDDADEKATRLYAVIGRLNQYLPEMSVRISNGGKYLLIDPATVFESLGDYYPAEWNEQVTFEQRDAAPISRCGGRTMGLDICPIKSGRG